MSTMGGNVMRSWLTIWIVASVAVNHAQLATPDNDTLPGEPGKDYPINAEIPKTSFSCQKQPFQGYYADVETGCQAYHLCETGGSKSSFLCPNGTIFNQSTQKCDEWYNVECERSPQLFWHNKYFDESKRNDSTDKSDSKVDIIGEKENNSSVSQNGDKLNLKDIQDLIDSEINRVLFRKKFEAKNFSSSPDIETNFQKLQEALSKSDLPQFKDSLDGIISSRVEAKKDSMKLGYVDNVSDVIDDEQSKKEDSMKKAKTAEKMFLLLSYLDKIKATLSDAKSQNNGSEMDATKNKVFPRIGEKLFKILGTLEGKQNTSNNSRANENVKTRLDISKEVDFFDNYKYFVNKNEINTDKDKVIKETDNNSKKENETSILNTNILHSTNGSTLDKDLNVSDEDSVEMIERIMDIAQTNRLSGTGDKEDNASKSNETSLVHDSQTNSSQVVDDSSINGTRHKSILDIINSYGSSEENSKSDDEIKTYSLTTNTSHVSGEVASSKDSYENNSSINDDSDEYLSKENIIDDVSNKLNSSIKNESNVENGTGNASNIDNSDENVNIEKSNNENDTSIDVHNENVRNETNTEVLKNGSFDWMINSEIIDGNRTQNATVPKHVSNEESLEDNEKKTYDFLQNLTSNVNRVGDGNHTDSSGDKNSTSTIMNQNSTVTNNVTNANVSNEEDRTVDKNDENTESDKNMNTVIGQNNNNTSGTLNVFGNEGFDVLNQSGAKLNNSQPLTADDNEVDENNDELIGILKGIYTTMGEKQVK